MTMQLLDRSNYLKGLLILIRKDNLITPEERDLVLECGVSLGFEKKFCETAIDELLENEYLLDTPPVFSSNDLAESFIKDAIKVALADKKMHLFELQWLIETAASNNLPEKIVDDLLRYYISDTSDKIEREEMEYQKMTVG